MGDYQGEESAADDQAEPAESTTTADGHINAKIGRALCQWLDGQKAHDDDTRTAVLKRILEAERQRELDAKLGKPRKPRTRKEKILAAVFESFDLHLACAEHGISFKMANDLIEKDPAFKLEVESARRAYVAKHEQWLVRVSMGGTKLSQPAVTAGIAFQNSNNPAWGRTRIETVKQSTGPLFKAIAEVAREKFGETSEEAKEFLQNVKDRYEMRIAGKFSN